MPCELFLTFREERLEEEHVLNIEQSHTENVEQRGIKMSAKHPPDIIFLDVTEISSSRQKWWRCVQHIKKKEGGLNWCTNHESVPYVDKGE